jgi:peroxiredoxin
MIIPLANLSQKTTTKPEFMKIFNLPHWKFYYAMVLIMGAIWIGISAASPNVTTNGAIPAPQTGFLAPEFSLMTNNGEEITLSELRGQPVVVNIWASWCPPCRAEMPALESVYQEYKDQGFVILAVNATNQDDPDQAIAFAQSLGLSFPILFDDQGEVSNQYQVRALPSTFFVDAHGVIREVIVGGPMSEALLRIRVQQLMESARSIGQ